MEIGKIRSMWSRTKKMSENGSGRFEFSGVYKYVTYPLLSSTVQVYAALSKAFYLFPSTPTLSVIYVLYRTLTKI